jgi:superfamily II DNA/RNA helicase
VPPEFLWTVLVCAVVEVYRVGPHLSLAKSNFRRNCTLLEIEKKPAGVIAPRKLKVTPNDAPINEIPTFEIETTPLEDADAVTFADLGLSPKTVAVLAEIGITVPSPIQTLTIRDALAGKDVCGKARTGSGKTLAFGLPMIERLKKGRPHLPAAVVLVPTRELAVQVCRAIHPVAEVRGLRIGAIYGGVSLNPQAQMLRYGVDIVVATPGRLNDLIARGECSMAEISLAVLDEADQMADFGFMPQIERILDGIEGEHQTLLFSATLDGDVDRLVRKYQTDPVYHEAIASDEDAADIQHRFIGVEPHEKVAVTAAIAAGPERTLLFVRTQRGADRLVNLLDREGIAAGTLHGGMSQNQRERSLRSFSTGRVPVLVATNIAARGIHVDGIDIVVHHDPPEDAKTYLHRSGRTGRAGAAGLVVTLVQPDEMRDFNFIRRQAGIRQAVVPMGPTDERLADLTSWEPPVEEERPARQPQNFGNQGSQQGAPRREWRPQGGGSRPHNRRPRTQQFR